MTRLSSCLDCKAIIGSGMTRCYACRHLRSETYNATRPAHHALYRTAEWKKLSTQIREGATRCHWCLKPTRRLVADHVVPLEERPDLALERSNLVAACVPCNTRRGRNARLPDIDAPRVRAGTPAPPHPLTVGERNAAIFEVDR